MPRRHREDCTSDSELADSTIDPFEQQSETEVDIPTLVNLSDSDARLYRKEMAKATAAPSNDRKSKKEDSDDCEIIEMEERNALQRNAESKSRSSDQMIAIFLNATRKLTETLEGMRRQELMQSRRKASRKSLDFDEFHTSPESADRKQRRRVGWYKCPTSAASNAHIMP